MYSSQYVPGSQTPRRQVPSVPRLTSDCLARQSTSPGPGEPTSSSTTTTRPASGKTIARLLTTALPRARSVPGLEAEQLLAERRQPGGRGIVLLPVARIAREGVALGMVELAPEPDALQPLGLVVPIGRVHRDVLSHADAVVRVVRPHPVR